ncbi:MAG: Wzz/FepE/Etk N-terminal domain-containing protein [Bacilli bacterium]|nr:Wzz/FepE/Etk N-terminal domain-containing protein [Bacilli bacterium]
MEEQVLSIKDIVNILRKRLVMIIVITLITTISSIILTYFIIEPTYTTNAALLIGKKNATEEGKEYNSSDVQMYQKLMGTYAKVVQSKDVIKRAIERGNLNLTYGQISSSLSVSTSDSDQILNLSYTSKTPQEGVDVLNPLIEEFDETSKEIISNGEMFVLTTPEMPSSPSSPNKKMNIMVGVAIGLMIGVSLALFLEYIDDSVKTNEDVELLIDVPVIGTIPVYNSKWGLLDSENSLENNKEKRKKSNNRKKCSKNK